MKASEMKAATGVSSPKFIRHENVGPEYLNQRSLHKKAGWISLWGLGVGAVLSGEFFGWNFGLAAGGFWGLAIATVLMATMYVCMIYSISELTSALPHAGGFMLSRAVPSVPLAGSSAESPTPWPIS
jgi:ethanolamine permease